MTAELLDPRTTRRSARRAPWTLMYCSVADGADRADRADRADEAGEGTGPRPGDPGDKPAEKTGDRDRCLVTVTPARLARQLAWLRDHGLKGVGMRELLAARAADRGSRLVGLTFDDGYADFRTHALPLLLEHGHTATVFVLPGRLGGTSVWDTRGPRRALLDEAGIREAAAAGMEIGSHGLLHRDLTAVHAVTLAAEVRGSRRRLADLTGTAPEGFCYPYGLLDIRVLLAVRDAGYGYGCAVDPGPFTGRFALPRTYIGEADTGRRLHAKRWLHRVRRARLTELPGDGR
jgi:peptidoglycan/xylan/chitin deacetylase (PgdA/CDA1 family)